MYLGDISAAIKFFEIALTMSRKYLQKSTQVLHQTLFQESKINAP